MSFNALRYHIDDFKTITTTNIALTTFDCPNYLRIFISSFVVLVYLKLQIGTSKEVNSQHPGILVSSGKKYGAS